MLDRPDLTTCRYLASQLHPTLAGGGGILYSSSVRLSLCSVSLGILTTCSTPRTSRAGHSIATPWVPVSINVRLGSTTNWSES